MENKFYGPDLAAVHNMDFGHLAVAAAAFIGNNIDPKSHPKVLDLGCGSGNMAKLLIEQGFEVQGIDYSEDMIKLAKTLVPEASFIQASIFDYTIPPVNIITMIGEVICYLFDEKSSQKNIESLFKQIYKSLLPDGWLILDFLTPDIAPKPKLQKRIMETEDWSIFLSIDLNRNTKVLTRDITLFSKEGEYYRRTHEIHQQVVFDPEVMLNIIQEIGFEAIPTDRYENLIFRDGHIGLLCRKR